MKVERQLHELGEVEVEGQRQSLKGGYCLICIGRSPGMPYAVTQLLASVTYYTFQIVRRKKSECLGAVRHARKKCILNFMLCPQWSEFHKAFLICGRLVSTKQENKF